MLIAPGRCSSSYSSCGSTSTSCAPAAVSFCTWSQSIVSASILPEHVAEDDASCLSRLGDRDRRAVDLWVLAQVALRVLGGLEEVEYVAAAAEARPVATGGASKHNCFVRLRARLFSGVQLNVDVAAADRIARADFDR